jgi:hypothetical protein
VTIIPDRDVRRFMNEVITQAGDGGSEESQLEAALAIFTEWHINEAALSMWRKRELELSWDVATQGLLLRLTNRSFDPEAGANLPPNTGLRLIRKADDV